MQEGKTVVAFSATGEIDRRDFGVSFNHSLLDGSVVVGNKVVDRDRGRGRPGRLTLTGPAAGPRQGRSAGLRFPAVPGRFGSCPPVGRPCPFDRPRDPPHRGDGPRGHLRPGGRPRDRGTQGGGRVGHRPHRGPRLPAGRPRPDRRRGSRAVPERLVGGHRRPRARRALADSGVAPEQVVGIGCTSQWLGTVPVDGAGERHRPRHHLDGLAGRRRASATTSGARSTSRATRRPSWPAGSGAPAASRACRARTPSGHIHFLRQHRPDVYAAAAVFLEPVDYLNLRLTGLARASHDSITGYWVTDNRDIGAISYDDGLIELAGLERATLPDLVPTGSVLGGLAAGARRRAGAAGGHARGHRHGRPPLGRRRLGRGGELRRPPLHRHLQLDQLPRPVQEDGPADQHRLHPLGDPGPLPGGRRARDRRRLPDLAARQPALPRRRPVRRRRRRRPTTSSPPSTTWRRRCRPGRTACCSPRG